MGAWAWPLYLDSSRDPSLFEIVAKHLTLTLTSCTWNLSNRHSVRFLSLPNNATKYYIASILLPSPTTSPNSTFTRLPRLEGDLYYPKLGCFGISAWSRAAKI